MIRKRIAAALAVVALMAVAATPAVAGGHDEKTTDWDVGFFYGKFGEYVLFAGGSAVDACNDVGATTTAKVQERRDGTLTVKAQARNVPLYLYEYGGPAPVLLGETCEALFDGDPSTNPQEPFAVGTGRTKIRNSGLETLDDEAGIHVFNRSKGTVTAADGTRFRVRGQADFATDETGFPIGSPADFQSLRVHQIGG